MASQSQIDADVNLYFVVPNKHKSEDECAEDMWHAYNKCCEHDLQPVWIDEKKCCKMKPVKNDVFVMEEFEGSTFQRLQTFKCPIIGPRCLLLCFINGEPIPEGTSPVYTTAMRGLCICVSGLPSEEKKSIEKLVEYMGGIFTKELRNRVTHLVTASVMSTKYETAVDMKISIVTKEWVEAIWKTNLKEFVQADDSMFDKYKAPIFLNLIMTSTNIPKRQREEIKNLINNHGGTFMSSLDGLKVKVVLAPEDSRISEKLKYAKQKNIACLIPDWVYGSIKAGYALPFKDFFVKSSKACSTPEKSTATWETFNCSTISSIPCEFQQSNCVDESLLTTISNASTFEPPLSNISTANSRGKFQEENVLETSSLSSKRNLQMLQKPRKVPIPSFDTGKKLAMPEKEKEPNLVQRYLQDAVVTAGDETMQEFLKPLTPITEGDNENTVTNRKSQIKTLKQSLTSKTEQANKYSADYSAVPISQTSTLNDRLFEGLTFIVIGFSEEDSYIVATIAAMNGQLVSSSFAGVPDYGVLPICGASLKHTVNEVVTDLFIEDCVSQEQIVDIAYYHRPLSIKKHSKPLSNCVITMSTYSGVERTYLVTLATELGAMCQDNFIRKTNVGKTTVHGSTHLVCPAPEGNKYNAAVKWKLPAVTADWLKSCAAQSKRVDEAPYFVGETTIPERPNQTCNKDISSFKTNSSQMGPPVDPPASNINTPKLHHQSGDGNSGDTPLINKRLNLLMDKTPQSPFHVSTPETPYGQIFKPNPSPDTRKDWVKWVNNFPDLRVEEPPARRRPLSTPLSELKRQLWQKLKNLGQNTKDPADETLARGKNESVETPRTRKDKNCKVASVTPINKKLEFRDEDDPLQNNEINMQIAQLDQILRGTSNTPEKRYPLSGENADTYDTEPSDPIQKFTVKDSQPIDAVVWEDSSHSKRSAMQEEQTENTIDNEHLMEHPEELSGEPEPPKKLKFMLSGIKDRTVYEQVIKDLGGDVSTDAHMDVHATHLLCVRPSRNEKMLGSIASGKWVLHCLYLRDSEHEGRFLDEEKYEWGNPKSRGVIPEPSGEVEETIAAAAYRWRVKLLKEPKAPFHDMVAILLAAREKYDQFRRLIEAGGGKVVQARPPYDTSPTEKKITHCFVNVRQLNQSIDWGMLASKGILCVVPQYLSEYLIARKPLNPRECMIPEFKKVFDATTQIKR